MVVKRSYVVGGKGSGLTIKTAREVQPSSRFSTLTQVVSFDTRSPFVDVELQFSVTAVKQI